MTPADRQRIAAAVARAGRDGWEHHELPEIAYAAARDLGIRLTDDDMRDVLRCADITNQGGINP